MGACMSTVANVAAGDGTGERGMDRFDRFIDFGLGTAQSMKRGGNLALSRGEDVTQEYVTQAAEVIPALVIIYSGCEDSQTSADVGDVTSFGLPTVSASQKAGGACTNGLLSVLKKQPNPTYSDVLLQMRSILKERGYEQIPQLSSSRQIDMKQTVFSMTNTQGSGSGKRKAVLVGINYTGHSSGQLNGCVNDVRMMERTLSEQGYSSSDMRILTDDPSYGIGQPTKDNIVKQFQWLAAGAAAGDSLFVHYSGHGTSAGQSSSEVDGRDEAIVPVDYDKNGLITDDMLFQILVAPLPAGVQLVGVFDCCHSGTIVDLPFIFSATNEGADALAGGGSGLLGANGQFSFMNALKLIAAVAQKMGVFPGAKDAAPANYKAIAASFLSAAMAAK